MRQSTEPGDDTPTREEVFPPVLSVNDHAELLEWYKATEKVLSDPELEDMWAEEQVWRERFEKQQKDGEGAAA